MNKLRGEVKVTIEGKEYTLSSSFHAVMEAEDAAGKGVNEIAYRAAKGDVAMKDVAAVIYGGLVGSGISKYSFLKIGAIVRKEGMIRSKLPKVAVRLLNFMVSPEEVEAAEKKPEADPST